MAGFVIERTNEHADKAAVVGECGFYRLDPQNRNGEFGIILHHAAWGGPAATECHLLCLRHGFEDMQLHRIEFNTAANNVRMQRFFERCGITREARRRDW